MRLTNKIVLATHNAEKLREFRALFAVYPQFELVPASEMVRNAAQIGEAENHATYLENAIAKARLVGSCVHYPALADDSGLEVEALDNEPGLHSARYAAKKGKGPFASRAAQDAANLELLLEELKTRAPSSRGARFVCTLALVMEGLLIHATGILEGTITEEPRGANGFGYDPIFLPRGSTRTLAEMTDSEKNLISHRAKAVHDLMAQVRARNLTFVRP